MNIIKPDNITFASNHRYIYERIGLGDYRIKSLIFDRPNSLAHVLSEIQRDDVLTECLQDFRYYTKKTISQALSDIASNEKLKKIKVKGLINYGHTALVFETEEGDILKITNRDHFLGRQSEVFDLPIKEHIKSKNGFCHYYLEDKAVSDISSSEIDNILQKIKDLGYKLIDIKFHNTIRKEQFGKINNEVYLIDPECARKRGFWGLLKNKCSRIRALINMARQRV